MNSGNNPKTTGSTGQNNNGSETNEITISFKNEMDKIHDRCEEIKKIAEKFSKGIWTTKRWDEKVDELSSALGEFEKLYKNDYLPNIGNKNFSLKKFSQALRLWQAVLKAANKIIAYNITGPQLELQSQIEHYLCELLNVRYLTLIEENADYEHNDHLGKSINSDLESKLEAERKSHLKTMLDLATEKGFGESIKEDKDKLSEWKSQALTTTGKIQALLTDIPEIIEQSFNAITVDETSKPFLNAIKKQIKDGVVKKVTAIENETKSITNIKPSFFRPTANPSSSSNPNKQENKEESQYQKKSA
ncbi:MAG TPA: hypothetical protein VHA13_01355 [Gammaproteobacteria bacterium]|nr:hypothetical protein [Gammaproteobacteria bacterium]